MIYYFTKLTSPSGVVLLLHLPLISIQNEQQHQHDLTMLPSYETKYNNNTSTTISHKHNICSRYTCICI